MVIDKVTEKPRGYAFVEFEDEVDMHGKLSRVQVQHIRCLPTPSSATHTHTHTSKRHVPIGD